MFLLLVDLRPSIGAAPQLKPLAEELFDHRAGQGAQGALSEFFWGHEGPKFRFMTRYDSLAAAEADRAGMQSDQKSMEIVSRMGDLIGSPASWSLRELVVPAENVSALAKFAIHVTLQAAPGKQPDLKQALVEWCSYSNSQGNPVGLTQEVWGHSAGRFGVRVPQNSLDEAAEQGAALVDDPQYRRLLEQLPGVLHKPSQWEVSRNLKATG